MSKEKRGGGSKLCHVHCGNVGNHQFPVVSSSDIGGGHGVPETWGKGSNMSNPKQVRQEALLILRNSGVSL